LVRNRIPLYLGDWPWGRENEIFTTTELDSDVGGIPTVRGDGLMHRPHGSDWSSIREAGLKAAQPGACPRDAASRDRVGYAEKGIITVVRLTQRKRLRRWSQKAQDTGPACFHVTGSHPHETRQSRPILPLAPNWNQERRTLQLLSKTGRGRGVGAHRKGCRRGLSQKPRPACNGRDMLTDSQAGGG
jgi:hypothetical protein